MKRITLAAAIALAAASALSWKAWRYRADAQRWHARWAALHGDPAGQRYGAVLNVGTRPTLRAGRSIEAHLFDVDRDLYGRTLRITFVKRLRDERRFDGLDALRAQIARDADEARATLSQEPDDDP